MKLIIVESPAKAKKIGSYLGKDYVVKSSIGHIRDIPIPSKLPKELKKGPYAKFGINVEDSFDAFYKISEGKSKVINELKADLKNADELLLATDEDREGEAIAWHLLEELKPGKGKNPIPYKRMVFHEISKKAILEALENTRDLDENLIDAQESRRILDRLYGYEFSPLLWKKVKFGLSAGRVQSVATKLIVDKEKERMAFITSDYSDITAILKKDDLEFESKLTQIDGNKIAGSKDFNSSGELTNKNIQLDFATAEEISKNLSSFKLQNIEEKAYSRKPFAPYTTSSLQQDAINRLNFSSRETMALAQKLYENGYITYMRTDSVTLSPDSITAVREFISSEYGKDYLPENPNIYTTKSKNAQEAHEAIRPAGDTIYTPSQIASKLDEKSLKLYTLIYNRTLASQMVPAVGKTTSLDFAANISNGKYAGKDGIFHSTGTVITFKGFLAAYNVTESNSQTLPEINKGDIAESVSVTPFAHTTKAPARYTEASLIKTLEEYGIGRPSTYSSIISNIIMRKYVLKKGSALVPTILSFAVIRLLENYFAKYVDYEFTAEMEEELDKIALGEEKKIDFLNEFYFGSKAGSKASDKKSGGLFKDIQLEDDIDPVAINSIDMGEGYTIRTGKFSPYIEYDSKFASINEEEISPDELTLEKVKQIFEEYSTLDANSKILGKRPETGFDIALKTGAYGPYFTEVLPEGTITKGKGRVLAKKGALLSYMNVETVTLEDALKVLSLPRELGIFPGDEQKITANNGRFGPYLAKKDLEKSKVDFRSIKATELESKEQRLFSITLEEAIEVYNQPKVYRTSSRKSK
ncbi:MAG: type I DNA topoisomerase [Bifidobacteriaceae bacterium]|jgi:DNA topoisomerase-1|nr:type I DNA topoisomerase [Bifidobacteriaceae bacterium]